MTAKEIESRLKANRREQASAKRDLRRFRRLQREASARLDAEGGTITTTVGDSHGATRPKEVVNPALRVYRESSVQVDRLNKKLTALEREQRKLDDARAEEEKYSWLDGGAAA